MKELIKKLTNQISYTQTYKVLNLIASHASAPNIIKAINEASYQDLIQEVPSEYTHFFSKTILSRESTTEIISQITTRQTAEVLDAFLHKLSSHNKSLRFQSTHLLCNLFTNITYQEERLKLNPEENLKNAKKMFDILISFGLDISLMKNKTKINEIFFSKAINYTFSHDNAIMFQFLNFIIEKGIKADDNKGYAVFEALSLGNKKGIEFTFSLDFLSIEYLEKGIALFNHIYDLDNQKNQPHYAQNHKHIASLELAKILLEKKHFNALEKNSALPPEKSCQNKKQKI